MVRKHAPFSPKYVISADHKCCMQPENMSMKKQEQHRGNHPFSPDMETSVKDNGEPFLDHAVVQDMHGEESIFPHKCKTLETDVMEELYNSLFSLEHRE